MGKTLASLFFLLFRGEGFGLAMSSSEVLSRIFAAALRTSKNTW
jgi:hypothetical protein